MSITLEEQLSKRVEIQLNKKENKTFHFFCVFRRVIQELLSISRTEGLPFLSHSTLMAKHLFFWCFALPRKTSA